MCFHWPSYHYAVLLKNAEQYAQLTMQQLSCRQSSEHVYCLYQNNSPHRTHYIARLTYPSSPLHYEPQISYFNGLCCLLIGSFWCLERSYLFLFVAQWEGKKTEKQLWTRSDGVWKSHQEVSKFFKNKSNHTAILPCELWTISDIKLPFWIVRSWALSAGVGGAVLS